MSKKTEKPMGAYSAIICDNDELVEQAASLYLKNGYRVADVTWGKGVFWRRLDLTRYDFHKSDIITCPQAKYDFRNLPYKSSSFDVVVLDPPYCHNPGEMIVDANYQNKATTKGLYHKDIIELYRNGMKEACRILKDGGTLWVKCKDEIESSYQRWSHVEILDIALKLGMYGKDLFVLIQKSNPVIQHAAQQHSRKNHSYLWIFKKPLPSESKSLKRYGIFKRLEE